MAVPRMPRYHRQRFLLLLLGVAGRLSKRELQSLLFLSRMEAGFSYYDFVPYRGGCHSFQAQADVELLVSWGWLEDGASVSLLVQPGACLGKTVLAGIGQFMKRVEGLDLVQYVCEHYPYYATRCGTLDDSVGRGVDAERALNDEKVIYTLGYEGLSLEAYINRLLKHDVRLLCDVRRNPFSRKFGFSKGMLGRYLPELGIGYLHVPELGIRSELRRGLDDYTELFRDYRSRLPEWGASLRELECLLEQHGRIALTCYERAHQSCHRHCISDYLEQRGSRICHL